MAVKVLHSESSDDHLSVARFERGARQMEQLHHPHIVRVLGDPAEQDGFHYFVMEYLGGGDLARATAQGMLRVLDKLRIIIEVGSALHFAHERQLIHRDIKPDKITPVEKWLSFFRRPSEKAAEVFVTHWLWSKHPKRRSKQDHQTWISG